MLKSNDVLAHQQQAQQVIHKADDQLTENSQRNALPEIARHKEVDRHGYLPYE